MSAIRVKVKESVVESADEEDNVLEDLVSTKEKRMNVFLRANSSFDTVFIFLSNAGTDKAIGDDKIVATIGLMIPVFDHLDN